MPAKKDNFAAALLSILQHEMTEAAKEAQRRSFVYGNTKLENDCVTRESIAEIAEEFATRVRTHGQENGAAAAASSASLSDAAARASQLGSLEATVDDELDG